MRFTEYMHVSQTMSMILRDALFYRVSESSCVHVSHVGLIYRFYLFHRVHVCFTDIGHEPQRCFVWQSLLLFRRVVFHRVRVYFTDFHRCDFGPFDVWLANFHRCVFHRALLFHSVWRFFTVFIKKMFHIVW